MLTERALCGCLWVLVSGACRSTTGIGDAQAERRGPPPVESRGSESPAGGAPAPEAVAESSSEEQAASGEKPRSPSSPLSDPRFRQMVTREGRFVVCWRPLSGEVPRNEDFVLEAWIFEDGRPVIGAQLTVQGRMPEHGHGMLRAPRTIAQGDGSYRVEGMLLHMRGHWQLLFDVGRGSQSDVAECGLDLR